MALYSALRRASSSILLLSIRRGLRTTTTFGVAAVSTAARAKKQKNSNASLLRIIDSEIKYAEETEFHDCAVEVPDDFPFEIQDYLRERKMVLIRDYRDEMIKVKVDMPDDANEEEDGDDDTEQRPGIPLVVTISRNGMCLLFSVTALPDEISIQSMSLKMDESSEDRLAYEGPNFSFLDGNIQKGFYKYLEVRGVGPKMANFLLEYMISKDSKEYFQWLKTLKEFVEK